MKILIVEDNYEKVQEVHAVFQGALKPTIKSVRSSMEAKTLMSEEQFDLLILDIQIPDIEGGDISATGGADLLSFVETSDVIKTPSFIMGLTSHVEGFTAIEKEFLSFGWPLFNTKADHEVWSQILLRKNEGLSKNIHNIRADVAIVTALEHTELEAVLKLNGEWTSIQIDGTDFYTNEVVNFEGEKIKLVATSSDRMGCSAASYITTKVGSLFKPKTMIMTGICAGVKGKVNLGDIVVADHVWDWSSGKVTEDDGEVRFLPEPHQIALSRDFRNIVKKYTVKCDFLEEIYLNWGGDRGKNLPNLHLAPMACGSQVIANSSIMDQILDGNRKMLALEMESYGFMNACDSMGVKAVVVKSICDYANSQKSDDAQEYAAYTSASFAFWFIRQEIRA